MRIALGSDHAGRTVKRAIAALLREQGHSVEDYSDPGDGPVDYPDVSERVARAVSVGAADRGILVCGTGIGSSIVANKVAGVRAALVHDAYTARMSREHNDANVLCLGERVLRLEEALDLVRIWLNTDASPDERHRRRVAKIEALDQR